MELSLSSEFGARIEAVLKELVTKTTQEAQVQQKRDMDDKIERLERRLGQLDEQIQTTIRFRSTALDMLARMVDELRAVNVATTPFTSDVGDDATTPVQSPQQTSPIAHHESAPQPVQEPVTLGDVQRFLMQRLPE
jgi:hypothetical protein